MKRCRLPRLLLLAAAFALLVAALAFSAAAADAIVAPEHALDTLPSGGRTTLDDFNGTVAFWQSPNGSSTNVWYVSGYGAALFCKPGDGGTVFVRRPFAAPVSLGGISDLLLYLESSHEIDVTLTLETDAGIYSYTGRVPGGTASIMIADISVPAAHGDAIRTLNITAIPTGDTFTELHILSIRTDTVGCREIVNRFGSTEISVSGGDAEISRSGVRITPTETTPRLSVRNCTGDIPAAALFRIVVDAGEGGAMVLSMIGDDGSAVRCGSVTLGAGRHVYLLPVALRGTPYAYTVQFLTQDLSPVTVDSVTLLPLESADADTSRGTLTLCQISADGKSLTVSGKLTSEAAAAGIGGKIRLYAADAAGAVDVDAPLAETAVSTRFSFTVPTGGLHLTTSTFLAAVVMPDGTFTPIGDSWYVSGREADDSGFSVVGLTGASPADALLSNSSRVIVDVCLDRLLGGKDGAVSGTLCSWNGQYYDLDVNYVRELDDEMAFYRAAGLRVYLRFLAAEELSARGLTLMGPSNATYYAFNATTTEGQNLLSALTNYIAARYPSIAGIVVGYAMDEPLSNAASCDTPIYVRNYASAVRIIYHAALPYHPELELYVPVVGADGTALADGVSMTAQLSQLLSLHGGIPFRLLYVTASTRGADEDANFLTNRFSSAGLSFTMAACLRGSETVRYDDFAALCETARGRYTAVFLSAGAIGNDSFYEKMKSLLEDGRGRCVETGSTEDTPALTGTFSLWDFTSSFDALGWISDGTFDTPRTAASRGLAAFLGRSTCRALEATCSTYSKDAVLLCLADKTLLLADAPYVTLTLRATGVREDVWLTVLFGSGDTHTEYRVSLRSGECATVTCPLGDTAALAGIDYVAVSGDAGISSLEIASVTAGSTTKTDEELAVLLGGKTPDEPVRPDRHAVYIVIILAAAVTAIALLFLFRRSARKAPEAPRR